MENRKSIRILLIFTILTIVSLYIILKVNEESSNQKVPKKATFVINCIGEDSLYG